MVREEITSPLTGLAVRLDRNNGREQVCVRTGFAMGSRSGVIQNIDATAVVLHKGSPLGGTQLNYVKTF